MASGYPVRSEREAKWREWLTLQASSGLEVAAFCQQHGLRVSTFYGWRQQLRQRDRQRTGSPAFLPVKVSGPDFAGGLEILLENGRRLRLSGPLDRQLLREVVAVLEGLKDAEGQSC